MPFDSLRSFAEALQRAGELHVVKAQVDPYLEIAEITDRVVKAGGPALLFTNVKGSRFDVLTNQFGTQRRMARAFDANHLDEVAARLRAMLDIAPPSGASIGEKLGAMRQLAPLANAIPKTVRKGSPSGRGDPQARLARASGPDDVAARRRPVRHASARHHQRSANRAAQRRHVSHASLRSDRDRHALAAPQTRTGARRRVGRPRARRRRDRKRPGADLRRFGAAAARRRRVCVRGTAAR